MFEQWVWYVGYTERGGRTCLSTHGHNYPPSHLQLSHKRSWSLQIQFSKFNSEVIFVFIRDSNAESEKAVADLENAHGRLSTGPRRISTGKLTVLFYTWGVWMFKMWSQTHLTISTRSLFDLTSRPEPGPMCDQLWDTGQVVLCVPYSSVNNTSYARCINL